MKEIELSNRGYAIVGDEDFEYLSKFKWILNSYGYVYNNRYISGKQIRTYMHRLVMNAKKGQTIDHINGVRFDNRKNNLRFVTPRENTLNSKQKGGTSKYKGVNWNKGMKKWEAKVRVAKKDMYRGFFHTEIAAAIAYDEEAQKIFGEYAALNFPPGTNSRGI